MNKWVDTDVFIKSVVKSGLGVDFINSVTALIIDAPSLDLVRCAECKYHTSDDECTNPHWDSGQDLYPKAMEYDYCSYGVRMESE